MLELFWAPNGKPKSSNVTFYPHRTRPQCFGCFIRRHDPIGSEVMGYPKNLAESHRIPRLRLQVGSVGCETPYGIIKFWPIRMLAR